MQIDRVCWNGEYLCVDLQELGSVYRPCSQLAYCSKTEARAIFRNKRIQNCKQVEFVPHPSSCTATKSGLCDCEAPPYCCTKEESTLQIEVMHVALMCVC